jgi:hypothetical protein
MENINFISANQLPVAEGDEVSVLCVENGEMKQKPAKGLGGGGGHWVMLTDNGVVASEGIYEALEDFFVNRGVPVAITTYRAFTSEDTGYVYEFGAQQGDYIQWNTAEGYFSVSGTSGIVFYRLY